MQSVTLFSRAHRMRFDIQFLSAWKGQVLENMDETTQPQQ